MAITTLSSREFNQDTSKAKKKAGSLNDVIPGKVTSLIHGWNTWLENHVLRAFADRILSIDTAIALRGAALHVPDPHSERDSLVAATALIHGLTVVTRNVTDFAKTGVNVINSWNN
jgi:predicted nucleic acid-binding protein